MKLLITLLLVFSASSKALAVETGASLLGIAGTVVIHATGIGAEFRNSREFRFTGISWEL